MPKLPSIAGWRRRPRLGLSSATAELIGAPVGVAIPLQRHHPTLVLGVCVAELLALAALVLTGQLAAFVGLVALAAALVVLAATNAHRVLAITSTGVLVLVASARGRPLASIGPAPAGLSVPTPAGLAVAVELNSKTWWVDRSAFPLVRRGCQLLERRPDPTGTAPTDK